MVRIFNQYVSAKILLLIVVEALLIAGSQFCAVKLRFWNDPTEFASYVSLPDFEIQIFQTWSSPVYRDVSEYNGSV